MTMFRINPGKYRNIVTFQSLTNVRNPYGESPIHDDANWVDVYTTRVGIFPLSGKELVTAQITENEITHKIYVRYNPTVKITGSMRIKYGLRIFTIVAPPVNFQEKDVELQILCKEWVE
jgi:SPP1 family predicted phage head-tail adaptor